MVDFMLEFDDKKTCHFDKKRVFELMHFSPATCLFHF